MFMVKDSLEEGELNVPNDESQWRRSKDRTIEQYGERALAEWEAYYAEGRRIVPGISEEEFGKRALEQIRKRTLWGKILAEGTN